MNEVALWQIATCVGCRPSIGLVCFHRPLTRRTILTIPGLQDLYKEIKALEDHARASRSEGELQMVLVTREEVEVVESFRRFRFQDYD